MLLLCFSMLRFDDFELPVYLLFLFNIIFYIFLNIFYLFMYRLGNRLLNISKNIYSLYILTVAEIYFIL